MKYWSCEVSHANNPSPLVEPWVELIHSDSNGWQSATPSVRIALEGATALDYVAQGWVTQTADHNDDNVGAWLNWQNAPATLQAEQVLEATYSITAQ